MASLCKQETAVEPNFALCVLQAITNGEMKCGRLERSGRGQYGALACRIQRLACSQLSV